MPVLFIVWKENGYFSIYENKTNNSDLRHTTRQKPRLSSYWLSRSECQWKRRINSVYAARIDKYEDDYDRILCYDISFFKKRCMVKKK